MKAVQRVLIATALACGIVAVAGPARAASDLGSPTLASGAPADQARRADDRRLTRRVSAALARTRGLNATRIVVRARSGVVTLRGGVSDGQQAAMAVDAARQVDGVTQVTNQLRLGEQMP
ncbi:MULTISPECIES: BON domain-containing protein [unclassified Burkholderia]|uniref:BON domain-containing protein n=1 Tax=unclassified Burkholderia TaxID=2613784 RepID=UPI00197B3B1E|nr:MULTISPECIES: BON domain-containing protein [unclassified Burkholderia]HDR9484609.1 BON domain-containing protein [Burkholderia aenigmatica]MBN3838114.1 BON domain-containing protein [Burkholderia sp. Ac-20349]MDN7516793.1 BON domain-containing protein [Burkholderia sp. AU45251]HDR9515885.1 BON domain-containing protein [Burkholderia aenigmatica]HDR9592694.1 BON domain-containing protein [Burkholderia aenigmatica]